MNGEPGTILAGRYRILGLIGRGGMGRVWHAHDTELDREVAVKELRLPPGIDDAERREWYARVTREARAAARLRHPGIVALYDRVTAGDDGRPWLVMELIAGHSLDDALRTGGPLPVRRAATIGRQVLDALVAAHAAGIVHRDVKPANVLLDGDRAVLTDFGIAAMEGDATLTQSGALLGTPAYMSPEQVRGGTTTARSDLWALGATLYAAVEGRPPFQGPNHGAIFVAIGTEDPPPPVNAGPLTGVITGLLSKDPGARPAPESVRGLLDAAATSSRAVPHRSVSAGSGDEATQVDPDATVPASGPSGAVALARPAFAPVPPPSGGTVRAGAATLRGISGRLRPGRIAGIAAAAVVVLAAAIGAGIWAGKAGTASPSSSPTATATRPRATATPADRAIDISGLGGISHLAFSPDGTTLATADENDFTVRLWNAATGKQTAALDDAGNVDGAIAFSPDGKTLAAGQDGGEGGDDVIQLWNVASREVTGTFTTPHGGYVDALAFGPDGRTLAASYLNDDGAAIRLWDVSRSRATNVAIPGRKDALGPFAFSPDGRTLAYGDGRGIQRWDIPGRKRLGPISVPDGGKDKVEAVAFSPDGTTIAGLSENGLKTWDVATHKILKHYRGAGGGGVGEVVYGPGGHELAACSGSVSDNDFANVWDARTGKELHEYGAEGSISVAFSPDGTTLAGVGGDAIHLWRL